MDCRRLVRRQNDHANRSSFERGGNGKAISSKRRTSGTVNLAMSEANIPLFCLLGSE